ncbi:hypothetical protein GE09DRAFT_1222793 [Coniochaeta sp. 2T2.1]|nr:hypothetical protein GE09DRAFT_1222793 [Coniochaeta sp. 2T2.1]
MRPLLIAVAATTGAASVIKTTALTPGPNHYQELDHMHKRYEEENLVSKLLQDSKLRQTAFYRLKPNMQLPVLDCKLLFFDATGKFVDVQVIRDMIDDATVTTGPRGDYSMADCRMAAYVKDKIDEEKWQGIKQDFLAATGRVIDIGTLKEKLKLPGTGK